MPQSPHETGNQKRGLAHSGRKETPSFPFLPSLFLLPVPNAGRTGRQRMRLFAISPGSASICLSLPLLLCVTLSLSLSPHQSCCRRSPLYLLTFLCFSLSIPSSLCSVNLPLASLMSGLPRCLLHGSRAPRFPGAMTMFSSSPISASSHH